MKKTATKTATRTQTPVSQQALDADRALTAVQLKRIAEAVDGFRTGTLLYVVMRVIPADPPFDVAAVTSEKAEAQKVAQEKTKGGKVYRAFGPYQSREDQDGRVALDAYGIAVCHEPDSDDCEAKFEKGSLPFLRDITDVAVELTLSNARKPVRIDCDDVADAIFIGMPAIDKFWIPYLERVYGVDVAQKKRKELIAKVRAEAKTRGADV